MRVKFSLIDMITGDVIVEGLATHYSFSRDGNGNHVTKIEGHPLPESTTEKPLTSTFPQSHGYRPLTTDVCGHEWTPYTGLNQPTKVICSKCGVDQ